MSLYPNNTSRFGPIGNPLVDGLNSMVEQVNATRGIVFGPAFDVQYLQDGMLVNLDQGRFSDLPREVVRAKVTAWEALTGEDTRWKYTMQEIGLTLDLFSAPEATAKTGAQANQFTAYNWREINNVAQGTGTQGNSIDESATDYAGTSMTIQPVGGGTGGTPGNEVVIECERYATDDGKVVWMFDYENAVDGAC